MYSLIREALAQLDMEFIARSEKCSSFNIPSSAFENTEKKEEIRYLIQTNWFEGRNIKFYDKFSKRNLEEGIAQLRNLNKKSFEKLFMYNAKGYGPGEVMCYFLFDDVSLGGGSSAGVDIITPNSLYEMKAVVPQLKAGDVYGTGKYIANFKLGGTVSLNTLITELKDMKKEASKIEPKMGKAKEVGMAHYYFFSKHFPERWKKVLSEYQEIAYGYFEGHNLVCLANKPVASYKLGDVVFFGKVKKENILMGNMTAGTIKPIIKV